MNLRRLSVAVVAASAVALSVAVPAHASAPAAPSGKLTIYTVQTQRNVLDLDSSNSTTVGDVVVGSGTVALTKGGKSIGTYAYRSETVRVNIPGGNENRLSTSAYVLPGGTILVQGLVSVQQGTRPTKPQPLVIVGGTGDYAGANGTVTLSPRTPNKYTTTFTFTS